MLSMLWFILTSCLFIYWEVSMISIIMVLVLSLLNLNQLFLYSETIFGMVESVSSLMIMLSILLCFLSILCSPNIKMKSYLFLILLLGAVLIMAFYVNNIILFYIFFEVSLIPTLMLIIGWGYQPERLQAGTHMMLYTVGASLPLLVFLIFMGIKLNSFNFFIIQCLNPVVSAFWLIMTMLTAFLVKLPMYMYHLWLPKAHVEAPLAGSMILAGILLKLGGYGLYLMFKMFSINFMTYEIMGLVSLSMWGALLACFMCLKQTDMKSFVAYSSIAHMSLIVASVFLNTTWGFSSMKIILFAHGFTSPALFFLAYITYIKSGSRSLMHTSGILVVYPILSLMWFLMLSVNMAAPPTLNLLGELIIIPTLWMMGGMIIITMMLLMLFGAIYNMFLYTSVNHGGINKFIFPNNQLKSSDLLGMLGHMLPLFLLFKMSYFVI